MHQNISNKGRKNCSRTTSGSSKLLQPDSAVGADVEVIKIKGLRNSLRGLKLRRYRLLYTTIKI